MQIGMLEMNKKGDLATVRNTNDTASKSQRHQMIKK